jgi:hypothetical protein
MLFKDSVGMNATFELVYGNHNLADVAHAEFLV